VGAGEEIEDREGHGKSEESFEELREKMHNAGSLEGKLGLMEVLG